MTLDKIEDALAAIAAGRMVVVVDDEDRENEGDLIMAAALAKPEDMAFIVRHTSGIVCAPLTREDARRLKLDPMVSVNDAPLATAFTVSVDYRPGLTTGISAEERTATVRALANGNVGAGDFVRPGHVFPLIAREGGVLMRSGHTEAAVDLARLAGQPPVGLICELVNDDGTVKKGPQIMDFAKENDLLVVSIADLIAYRQKREKLAVREASFEADTRAGRATVHVYDTPFDDAKHLAVVYGEIGDGRGLLARLHREDALEDAFGAGGGSLGASLDRIREEGRGVVVYLRDRAAGVAPDAPAWGEEPLSAPGADAVWRDVGLGAQILRDIGARSIRLMASRERQYVGLSGFGVDIEGTEIV